MNGQAQSSMAQGFYDKITATMTYVVWCKTTQQCAIIDSVLDYDPETGHTSTQAVDPVIAFVKDKGLTVQWILETHIHADHFTAASYVQEKLGGKIGIGERIQDVLQFWVPLYNTGHDTPQDGVQFDHLFKAGECFKIGELSVEVLHTPGHTPACLSYYVAQEVVFVGDSLFMPPLGTARVDFPGGSARHLYDSIQKLFQLPDATGVFVGHIYPQASEEISWVTTIAEQKQANVMVNAQTPFVDFQEKRDSRDKTLKTPRLLLPALQVNLRAGNLGQAEGNGVQYLKIPLNKL